MPVMTWISGSGLFPETEWTSCFYAHEVKESSYYLTVVFLVIAYLRVLLGQEPNKQAKEDPFILIDTTQNLILKVYFSFYDLLKIKKKCS